MRRSLLSRVPMWAAVCAMFLSTQVYAQPEAPESGRPVDDPLVVKPKTIPENFDAALLMVKLVRLDLAKYYLQQTLELSPSDSDLMALRSAHGTGTFLELSRLEELNPPATQLLNLIQDAVKRQVEEPGYAEGLIKKLNGSSRERSEALSELQHLGSYAVPPILKSLVGDSLVGRDTLSVTLTRLGTDAVAPLIGALNSPNQEVRTVALEVLGRVGSESDAVWLWYPAFAEGQNPSVQASARDALARIKYQDVKKVERIALDGAPARLLQIANEHLTGTYVWPSIYEDQAQIPVWNWSEQAGTVVEFRVPREKASLFFAERLAREAASLAPESEQAPVVQLAALLIRAVEANQWNSPLPIGKGEALDLAVRCGPDVCQRVLGYALDQKLSAAAVGSLEALALNGSPSLLERRNGRSAVIEALDSSDQRVQFAAATTIMHWEPTRPFSGSQRVIEILARAINAESRTASVVMDPNTSRAQQTASLFSELGFTASLVSTGREGFQVASERGDIALAVLHPNVIRWELTQTIANLRADSRTADIPVVIYGPRSIRDRFNDFASQFQKVVFIEEGNSSMDLSRELAPFLVNLNPPAFTQEQRKQQMLTAAAWLRRTAVRDVPGVFDLLPAETALVKSIYDPEIGADAIVALGAIGRVSVQNELLNVAVSATTAVENRRLAASQLAFHIQRYGLLLTPMVTKTIPAALNRETDPQVRLALASVIGSLQPSPAAVRKELLTQPASLSPEFLQQAQPAATNGSEQ
ncbi:HEAT repeat domain-containing protein [Planctomicrobium sp. SH527]|uniref:HEAT repeat domain-containing protein n=1 Tax=Planctomicrobium sp. SH527 TaxID=3448123 RepID=UPI003F5BC9CA